MADDMIVDEVVSSSVTPELTNLIAQLGEVEKKIKDINLLKVNINGELKAADSLSAFNAAAAKTEELLASINAVAKENVSVVKAMEQASKNEAAMRTENAKAALLEAKTLVELEKQKQLNAKADRDLLRDKEKLEKAQLKEIANLEKQQSAYAKLNTEYKAAANEAKNLGAEVEILNRSLTDKSLNANQIAAIKAEIQMFSHFHQTLFLQVIFPFRIVLSQVLILNQDLWNYRAFSFCLLYYLPFHRA